MVKSDSVTPNHWVAKPPKSDPRPPERLLTDMSAAYNEASTPGGQMLAVVWCGVSCSGTMSCIAYIKRRRGGIGDILASVE